MREVARNDYDRALQVLRWPVRELLIAYLEAFKDQLREDLRHRQLMFQIRVAWGGGRDLQPPQIPPLLREPEQ